MRCSQCGLTHADDIKYCPVTGKKIDQDYSPEDETLQYNDYLKEKRKSKKSKLIILAILLALVFIGFGVVLIMKGFKNRSTLASKGESIPDVLMIDQSGQETKSGTEITSRNPDSDSIMNETNAKSATPNTLQELEAAGTTSLPTITHTLTQTLVPQPTLTPSFSPTAIQSSNIIDESTNLKDDMVLVYVPEGEFLMGSDPDADPYFFGAEGPEHKVSVNAFWIYQTEVTNQMYQACVDEQACPRPLRLESRSVEDYYTNPNYADYPVIQVNWVDAVSYCNWAGGRLPTEAEWEKAARGTDGRMFPWGDGKLEPHLANFCGSSCLDVEYRMTIDDGYPEIAPVGSFPAGVSPYGALDMAGNVWEWVRDYFEPLYYDQSPYDNPLGPVNGDRHVIRGGSWRNPTGGIRTAVRASLPPSDGLDTVGFRCVIDFED